MFRWHPRLKSEPCYVGPPIKTPLHLTIKTTFFMVPPRFWTVLDGVEFGLWYTDQAVRQLSASQQEQISNTDYCGSSVVDR